MTLLLSAYTPRLPGHIYCEDALSLLRALPDCSIDAVITDPPYPEIGRDYGRMSETDWMTMMQGCVREFRRVLKPTGSAAIILQPNSLTPGTMRLWLWKFLVWAGEYWNIVQDAYWWNIAPMTTSHASQFGLMRGAVKQIVWIGNPDCYRNQDVVLWTPSDAVMAINLENRALQYHPSGHHVRKANFKESAIRRGGVTPMNITPLANSDSQNSAGANGHGAGTPFDLLEWWIRYISPDGGLIVDPFCGSGTCPLAARVLGRNFIAGDFTLEYVETARKRLAQPYTPPLFAEPVEREPLPTQEPMFADSATQL